MVDKGKTGTVIKVATALGSAIASNEQVQKRVLGEYSDGSVRSVADALNGEVYSPKQKRKLDERIEKRKLKNAKMKKKKSKKKKKKAKYYSF